MPDSSRSNYLDPSDEAAAALLARNISGEVVMLNLLRFREVADYSASPELAPAEPISGRDAYQKYAEHTLPFLQAAGGSVLYSGTSEDFLIGPPGKGWDLVLLVRQKSVADFFAFASDQEFLKGLGHRTAALMDSRLLPLADSPTVDV
ncbi:MAG: DUF1330 domain-containing protein [Proteobacteria bacterium]|nr:DUF1330 domain-containing protein [Pseudomonadota bacterium]